MSVHWTSALKRAAISCRAAISSSLFEGGMAWVSWYSGYDIRLLCYPHCKTLVYLCLYVPLRVMWGAFTVSHESCSTCKETLQMLLHGQLIAPFRAISCYFYIDQMHVSQYTEHCQKILVAWVSIFSITINCK